MKTGYHHGNLREALVQASLKAIRQEGMDRLTLRKVARLAGVSHAAPYAHFHSKAALLAAVKEEGFKQLQALVLARVRTARGNSAGKLRAMARAYLDFAFRHPTKFQVMFYNPLRAPEPAYDYIVPGQKLFETFETLVGEFLDETDRRRVRLAAFAAWSTLHGAVTLWIDGPLVHVAPELAEAKTFLRNAETLVDSILKSLSDQTIQKLGAEASGGGRAAGKDHASQLQQRDDPAGSGNR